MYGLLQAIMEAYYNELEALFSVPYLFTESPQYRLIKQLYMSVAKAPLAACYSYKSLHTTAIILAINLHTKSL